MPKTGNIRLFAPSEKKRWQKYLINIQKICKGPDWEKKYCKELKKHLTGLSQTQLQSFKQKLGYPNTAQFDDILRDKKKAITAYCYWVFSRNYRSSISRFLNLTGQTGKALQKTAFLGILGLSDAELEGIVLFQIWRKTAIFERDYSLREVTNEQITQVDKKVKWLAGTLSKGAHRPSETDDKVYHFKQKGVYRDYRIYWFLRQKSDEEEPSWPNNQRQKRFSSKILAINQTGKKIHLVVHNSKERKIFLRFLQRTIKLELMSTQSETPVNKAQLQKLFVPDEADDTLPVISVSYKYTNLPGNPKLIIQDRAGKNPVKGAVKRLTENKDITPEEISNISAFTLLFSGQPVKVRVFEGRFGYYKMQIPDRSLAYQDREGLISQFKQKTNIPINQYFEFEGKPIEVKEAINSLLNTQLVSISDDPPIYRKVLEVLYQMGLLHAPEEENKRYCVYNGCVKQYANTWQKGTCSECGGQLHLFGEYFAVKTDKAKIRELISDSLILEGYSVVHGTRKFNKRKTDVIEVYTPKGSVVVVPVNSQKIDSNLLEYLKFNDAAVVFAPYPYTSETDQIRGYGHGVVTVSDLIYNKLTNSNQKLFTAEIDSCLNATQTRIENNYRNALARLERTGDYDFHKFEEDTFSLVHFLLPTSQRLGDQFIGKRVPDGIAAIPLSSSERFCVSWDSKYSTAQYAFSEKPAKSAYYIKRLQPLPVVKNLGGLGSFIYISNNLPEKRFKKFAKRVKRRARWPGRIILLSSAQLMELCKHKASVQQVLAASPEMNESYYKKIAGLFSKRYRKIYAISPAEIQAITSSQYTTPALSISRAEV